MLRAVNIKMNCIQEDSTLWENSVITLFSRGALDEGLLGADDGRTRFLRIWLGFQETQRPYWYLTSRTVQPLNPL